MIRPGREPRPDSACTSADVLTVPERYAARHQRTETQANPRSGKTWGDSPELKSILESLRSKP